tara:strand:+ start:222 stop:365 length:144 start_codon:yes stop_codon:yes gene_type:complete
MSVKLLAILLAFSIVSCAQTKKGSMIDSFNYENIGKPTFGFPIRNLF